ncbi:MAG: sterol desaturase family protein [Chitinophagales bacterium]
METFIQSWLGATFFNSLRYFTIAGLAFIPFYLLMKDRFTKEKIQSKSATKKDFIREVKDSISTMVIFGISGALLLASPVRQYTQVYSEANEFGWLYLILSVALALVIHDTYFYWTHRWMHGKKVYKRFHLTHHLSINPSPWASYTFSGLEGVIQSGIIWVLAFCIPMHEYALLSFTVIAFVINVYGHLGYEIAPLWFRKTTIFKWMATSTYHNLHHSKFNGNFGLYFRWWDKWMNTEVPGYEKAYDKIQERRMEKGLEPELKNI